MSERICERFDHTEKWTVLIIFNKVFTVFTIDVI